MENLSKARAMFFSSSCFQNQSPWYVCVSRSIVSDSLRPHGLSPARLLCPWNSPGKNTGVGCHSLLQGIFPTQGLNLGLSHCRWILYCLTHQESPVTMVGTQLMNKWVALIYICSHLTSRRFSLWNIGLTPQGLLQLRMKWSAQDFPGGW